MKTTTIQVLVILFAVIFSALGQTQIETESQTVQVSLGDTAQLECKVRDLQQDAQVIWHFVDHNQTISTGDEIRASAENYIQKYTIYRPADDGSLFWNLEIYGVESSDMGSYICYVSGMKNSVNVIHHLQVLDVLPVPQAPHINVTDCCVASGVESCALPLCVTSTPLPDILMVVANDTCMSNNLVKVLSCGQDGRNHLGCCIRRGLSELCQNLCNGWGYNDGTDYSPCIGTPIIGLVECLKEGNAMLPSQPVDISAINTGKSIIVTWQAPLDNYDVVTGYKVQYKRQDADIFNTTRSLPSNTYIERLSDLEVNVLYEIRVVAMASSGASQPSQSIVLATGEVMSESNISKTIEDCCIAKNVSSFCQPYCDTSMYYMGVHPDILQCTSELDIMSRCIAGHGDHSPCCKRVSVPDVCLGLCRGEPNLSWEVVQCLAYMPLISACVIEGSLILPWPPKNTHIVGGSITSNSVVIKWEHSDNFTNGEHYLVSWRKNEVEIYNWTSVTVLTGTQYQIVHLDPATIYDVIVSTVNDRGSSLPELMLMVVTEGISNVIEKPFNETECCIEKGVSGDCLQLCEHKFRLSNTSIMQGLLCPQAIIPMLMCGTDGRNHTGCCVRESIPSDCLPLCNLQPGTTLPLDTRFLQCAEYKSQLSICFDEGKAILPRPPTELYVKISDVYSIVIDWTAPVGPNITSYLVEYSMDNIFWMKRPTTSHTFFNVDKLQPQSHYYFRVTSMNADGQSSPSGIVFAYTLPVPGNKTEQDWMLLWKNREDCCANSSIATECQSACVSGIPDDLDTRTCSGDMDKIVACAADGRDHTGCCTKLIVGFSPVCLPYCKGQPGDRSPESAFCLTFLGPILTCFMDGQGLLPSPPQHVTAVTVTSTAIHVTWMKPASNCDVSSCTYLVYIWEESTREAVVKTRVVGTAFFFKSLTAETTYRVSVVSYNDRGMSLPSPYLIITTNADTSATVSVSQAPSGVVDSGASVQLECVGLGDYILSVTWTRNNQNVSDGNLHVIKTVSDADQGTYTCSISFPNDIIKSQGLFLNIRYKPVVKKMTESTVLPGVNQDSNLKCEFGGFPDVVTWTKDGQTLQGESKYSIPTLITQLDSGRTLSSLIVKRVVSDDFGSYTCNGSNKFGHMHSTGALKNMFPVTPLPTSTPPNKTDVAGCCRSMGVPVDCILHICTYDIDINNIISNSVLTHCAAYLTEFFTCGADGKDHTQCCTKQGVKEYCLPFCRGVIPDHDQQLELLMCLPHADTLLNCAINGIQYIPSAPRNVQVSVYYDTVRVQWDLPEKNADKVYVYHIYYKSTSTPETYDAASKQSRSKDLQADLIKKGEVYTVWVVAVNDFGTSKVSGQSQVSVTALVPPAPSNLHGDVIDNVNIQVKWEPPVTHLRILKYALHYQAVNGQKRIIYPVGQLLKILLVRLSPNTMYTISVAASSSDGEGQRSNFIYVKTGQTSEPVPTKPESQSSGSKTVSVVVVLGIIFLVVVGVVAVLIFRRMGRPKQSSPGQTVGFENPQYSSGQRITGLPGESDNQFEYGKLREERDTEHSYMTLEHPGAENTDTPAMLNLDHA